MHIYFFFFFIVPLNSLRKTRNGIMNFHALFSPLPHSGSCTWTRWCSTDCSVTQRDQRPVQSSCIIHRMQSEYVNCGLQSKVSTHLWSARLCWMRLPNCNVRQNSMLPFWKEHAIDWWAERKFVIHWNLSFQIFHLSRRAPLDDGDVTGLGFVFCDPPIFMY